MSDLPPDIATVIRRAKAAMPSTGYDYHLEDRAQDLAYDAMEASEPNTKLRLAADALEVFPLSTEAWGVIGYHYLTSDDFESAKEMFETAVAAARQIHPDWGPQRTDPLEWGVMDHRPYLRAMQGLALAQKRSGNLEQGIGTAELVLRWHVYSSLGPNLCSWYLEANRLDEAEAFLAGKEPDHVSANLAYTHVLLTYRKLRQNRASEADLAQVLGKALTENWFIPDMLLVPETPTNRPDSYSYGEEPEATSYVMDNHALWQNTPGALEWLSFMRDRYGRKPEEQFLVELLRKHVLLVQLSADHSFLRVTQNKDKMLGRALPDFHLRPEVALPHTNGTPIHVHRRSWDRSLPTLWTQFTYDQVEAVPFWHILSQLPQESNKPDPADEVDGEPVKFCAKCRKAATADAPLLVCSACKLVRYCSVQCQKKHWKRHKPECMRFRQSKVWRGLTSDLLREITSFLTLRDKAAVCSLCKAWMHAATEGTTSVDIDPETVGPNVDGVLRFVSNRLRNLQHVQIHIEQGYFLCMNGETPVQLSGHGLNRFFATCAAPLKSISIQLGECCEKETSRILVEEHGLDSIAPRHGASLQVLELSYPFFDGLPSLTQFIQPFTNLRVLNLNSVSFDEYHGSSTTVTAWRTSGEFAAAISRLVNLRKLSIFDHGLNDNDFRSLLPILGELRALSLEGRFGTSGNPSPAALTDATLHFIAENCPKLQILQVSYNRRFTATALLAVAAACPLRELVANETGLSSGNLEELASRSSTLMLVRYGHGFGNITDREAVHLRRATTASNGRIVFVGASVYKPLFNEAFMQEHKRSVHLLDNPVTADESNGWNEWEHLL